MVAAPVRIADAPPPPPAEGPAPPLAAPVAPTVEVVALPGTGAGSAERAWAQALPWGSTDLERDFPSIFEQMETDPQISANTAVMLKSALDRAPVVQPFGAPKGHPDYAYALRISQFSQANLDRLAVPINQSLYELGEGALHFGHAAGELVYRTATWDAAVGPQLVLDRIKGKPRQAYRLVRDRYGNFLGALPVPAGQSLVDSGGTLAPDGTVNGVPMIPLSKLPILAHNPRYGDLRGRSALRPVYNAWYMVQQLLPELLALVARFGQPTVKLRQAPGASEIPQTDPITGATLPAKNAQKALLQAGIEWRSGGVIVLAPGQEGDLVEAQTAGEIFFNALTLFTAWEARGQLGQTLATQEGSNRSGTDASTHQDILAVIICFCKAWLADWLRQHVIARLVEYNFGPAALAFCPRVSLGQTDPHNFGTVGQVFAQLSNSKFWGPDGPGPALGALLDTMLGLPARDTATAGADGVLGTADDTDAPPPAPTEVPNAG